MPIQVVNDPAFVECTVANFVSDQILIFLGIAGIITLVKGPTANIEYFLKQWQTICATMSIDIFAPGGAVPQKIRHDIINALNAWSIWTCTQLFVRTKLLSLIFKEPKEDTPAPTKCVLR